MTDVQLPEMRGSDKQLKWAQELREKELKSIDGFCLQLKEKDLDSIKGEYDLLIARTRSMLKNSTSKFGLTYSADEIRWPIQRKKQSVSDDEVVEAILEGVKTRRGATYAGDWISEHQIRPHALICTIAANLLVQHLRAVTGSDRQKAWAKQRRAQIILSLLAPSKMDIERVRKLLPLLSSKRWIEMRW